MMTALPFFDVAQEPEVQSNFRLLRHAQAFALLKLLNSTLEAGKTDHTCVKVPPRSTICRAVTRPPINPEEVPANPRMTHRHSRAESNFGGTSAVGRAFPH